MLKKIKCILLSMIVLMSLVACESNSGYVSYISEFGPNESSDKYFYHYIYNDGYYYSTLVECDVDTMEEREVYEVEDPKNQKIVDYCVFDDGVLFSVKEKQGGNEERTLFYYDNKSGQNHLICSAENIIIYRTQNGPMIIEDEKYFSLEKEADQISLIESIAPDGNIVSSEETTISIVTEDGKTVTFLKKYNEDKFRYKVDDRTGTIDVLDGKYASNSGFSNDCVVEDGKVIGIVQYTNSKRWIAPKNCISYGELKGEVLYEFDPQTCKSRILYEIKGNKKLIAGYKNGQVYLYSGGKILKYSLDSGEECAVYELKDNPEGQLSFNWIGSTLVIFDENNKEIIDSVKVEN